MPSVDTMSSRYDSIDVAHPAFSPLIACFAGFSHWCRVNDMSSIMVRESGANMSMMLVTFLGENGMCFEASRCRNGGFDFVEGMTVERVDPIAKLFSKKNKSSAALGRWT